MMIAAMYLLVVEVRVAPGRPLHLNACKIYKHHDTRTTVDIRVYDRSLFASMIHNILTVLISTHTIHVIQLPNR